MKYKAVGSIKRYKARLVAKWYTQTYGIDYIETFAPIAKINMVKVLLSLVVNLDWPLQQFDVMNVFQHGECDAPNSTPGVRLGCLSFIYFLFFYSFYYKLVHLYTIKNLT